MLRRLGIRAKVLAVLAVPVLVLLLTASSISVQAIGQARAADTVSDVVAILPQYAHAAEALQQERTLSVQEAGGNPQSDSMTASRSSTDEAITALEVALRNVDLSALDGRVAQATQAASDQHTTIAQIRDRIDAGSVPASLVDSTYTDIIAADNDVPGIVAETLSERSLASRLTAYGAVADTIEQVLRAQPAVLEMVDDDGTDAAGVRELVSLFAIQNDSRSTAARSTNSLRLDGIQLPSRDADLTAMQLSLVSGNELTVAALDTTRWNELVDAELATLRPVATDLLDSASDRAGVVAVEAQREALLTIGITVLAAALSIVIAFVVARGIVVPLRRLTGAAGQIREELPRLVEQVAVPGESPDLTLADIPVESSDEVGQLAAAFNSVNATTLQVAREQAALRGSIAEMFVNVARRDQVLLGRQLAFIDSLERAEEDPAALANLFRLDHLATRMRRNAESLLVLAGIDSGHRLRDAMPLSDVVRTAWSEIEQYHRVELELHADPLMRGFHALPAAHLLAELLENATLFSEPGTPVVVSTGVDGDHVLIEITDQGLGMSPDELAEANATISSTSLTEALGAQRLGLFVVARLAQRLGARVSLSQSATAGVSGTTATVTFPVGLFTANDPALAGGSGGQRSAGADPDVAPPAAVSVDLAALTDGATTIGLPRRRVTGDAALAVECTGLPTEQDVVPAPDETTLAPEVTAEAGGWVPPIAPDGSTGLPSHPELPARGAELPGRMRTAESGADAPGHTAALPARPRRGLFTRFRGRAAVVSQTDGGTESDEASVDLPDAAPGDASTVVMWPESGSSDLEHVRLDALPVPVPSETPDEITPVAAGIDQDSDLDAGPPKSAPDQPEPEPAVMVVPRLAPDELLDEARDWVGWTDTPAAEAEPTLPTAGSADGALGDKPLAPAWSGHGAADPVDVPSWSSDPTGSPTVDSPNAWSDQGPQAAELGDASSPAVEPGLVDSGFPAEVAPLPDFASLVHGDRPEPEHRPRERRPFFSRRRRASGDAAPSQVVPAPTPPASLTPPASGTPAAPGAPVRTPALVPNPVPAPPPVAKAVVTPATPPDSLTPADTQVWLSAMSWSPLDEQGDAVASSGPYRVPAPSAHRPSDDPGAESGWIHDPDDQPDAWATPEPTVPTQTTKSPAWSPASDASDASTPSYASFDSPTFGFPAVGTPEPSEDAVASAWVTAAPQPSEQAAAAPAWSALLPDPETAAALPTHVPGAVPPLAPEPSAPAAARGAQRNVSAWASAWSPDGAQIPQPSSGSMSVRPEAEDAAELGAVAPGRRPGAPDADAPAMLALRADIQEQALSELSHLSSYRPQVVDRPAAGSLTRRVPSPVPAVPEIVTPDSGEAPVRDADGLRDRLSIFQSGTRRGRRALSGSGPDDPTPGSTPETTRTESEQQPVPPSPSW